MYTLSSSPNLMNFSAMSQVILLISGSKESQYCNYDCLCAITKCFTEYRHSRVDLDVILMIVVVIVDDGRCVFG